MCQQFWLLILNVSQARFYRVQSLYLEGKVCLEMSQQKKMSLKSSEAIAWMGNYIDRYILASIIIIIMYFKFMGWWYLVPLAIII